MTVAELTEEHHGWLVKVYEGRPGLIFHRTFVLGKGFGCGVRQWEVDGVKFVGLVDDQRSPGIVGTERHYLADTECELLRQVKKPRRSSSTTAAERPPESALNLSPSTRRRAGK